jgi:2-hydroxychromene-2-carboxylate isomerase
VPSFFVGDDMYFGNDRLDLLRLAVLKAQAEG